MRTIGFIICPALVCILGAICRLCEDVVLNSCPIGLDIAASNCDLLVNGYGRSFSEYLSSDLFSVFSLIMTCPLSASFLLSASTPAVFFKNLARFFSSAALFFFTPLPDQLPHPGRDVSISCGPSASISCFFSSAKFYFLLVLFSS